jgi:proteasome lid subunit RPN8/RPN11
VTQLLLPHKERRRLHDRAYRAQQRDQSEVCGAVVANQHGRCELRFLKNVGGRPGHFEIRLPDLARLRASLAGSQRRIIGVFHSHVVSEAVPGAGDIKGVPVRYLQLIYDVCGRTVRLWKVKAGRSGRVAHEVPLVLETRTRGRVSNYPLSPSHSAVTALAQGGKRRAVGRAG